MDLASWRAALRDEPLPAAVIDLGAFERNARKVAALVRAAGGRHTLRPATKSLRAPGLLRRILDADPVFQGAMVVSAEEAALLADRGFDDLLVAYPTLRRHDLELLRGLHARGKTVSLVVDSFAGVEAVATVMEGVATPFRLVAELDVSLRALGGRVHLGVRRSPLHTPEDVVALFSRARSRSGVRLVGVMGYDAQVAGLPDENPFDPWLSPVARAVRAASTPAVASLRRRVAEALASAGFSLELFNGGGTGSLDRAPREPWLTEVTAGSAFLAPHLFDYYSNVRFEPACFLALQVVRRPSASVVTCQSGGFIASGPPGWDRAPRPWLPEGLALLPHEGCGEVQTPLRVPRGASLEPGDVVLFRHAKAGELAEHFREYVLVSEGRVVGREETSRALLRWG